MINEQLLFAGVADVLPLMSPMQLRYKIIIVDSQMTRRRQESLDIIQRNEDPTLMNNNQKESEFLNEFSVQESKQKQSNLKNIFYTGKSNLPKLKKYLDEKYSTSMQSSARALELKRGSMNSELDLTLNRELIERF